MGWGQQQMLKFLGGEGYCYFLQMIIKKESVPSFPIILPLCHVCNKVLQTKFTTVGLSQKVQRYAGA